MISGCPAMLSVTKLGNEGPKQQKQEHQIENTYFNILLLILGYSQFIVFDIICSLFFVLCAILVGHQGLLLIL